MSKIKYRIISNNFYIRIFPVTIYMVQKSEIGKRFTKWNTIKCFDNKLEALELLKLLR